MGGGGEVERQKYLVAGTVLWSGYRVYGRKDDCQGNPKEVEIHEENQGNCIQKSIGYNMKQWVTAVPVQEMSNQNQGGSIN